MARGTCVSAAADLDRAAKECRNLLGADATKSARPSSIIQIDRNLLETKLDRLVAEKVTEPLNAMPGASGRRDRQRRQIRARRGAAQWLGTSALRSVNASAAKELSSMGQVGGDIESNMSVRTLDSLTVSIDTTAVLYVSLGLLAVMLVCVAISCIPMLRKSPRSLSELR